MDEWVHCPVCGNKTRLWMSNNIFIYYPMLLLATFIFIIGGDNCTCFGIGIIMWGFINFGDHFFYTIKDKKLTGGLLTGILFGLPIGLCVVIYKFFKRFD